jgi:hypothetical protein
VIPGRIATPGNPVLWSGRSRRDPSCAKRLDESAEPLCSLLKTRNPVWKSQNKKGVLLCRSRGTGRTVGWCRRSHHTNASTTPPGRGLYAVPAVSCPLRTTTGAIVLASHRVGRTVVMNVLKARMQILMALPAAHPGLRSRKLRPRRWTMRHPVRAPGVAMSHAEVQKPIGNKRSSACSVLRAGRGEGPSQSSHQKTTASGIPAAANTPPIT